MTSKTPESSFLECPDRRDGVGLVFFSSYFCLYFLYYLGFQTANCPVGLWERAREQILIYLSGFWENCALFDEKGRKSSPLRSFIGFLLLYFGALWPPSPSMRCLLARDPSVS